MHRNQFGGTIGGPVALPHIHDTFFFFGYQKTILHNNSGGHSAYVPTQANLAGDFSALNSASNANNPQGKVIQVIDPTTGLPFAGNYINPARFDHAALNVMKMLPKSTGNGLVFYQQPTSQTFDEYVARGDKQIGSKDRIALRYFYDNFANAATFDPNNLLVYADGSNIRYQNALISEAHTFSPTLLNNLTLNYSREVSTRGGSSQTPNMNDFGVNVWQPSVKAIQDITVGGFFSIGDSPHAAFERNNYTLGEDLHWVLGRHDLAFGGHAENSKIDINNTNNTPGDYEFGPDNTNYAAADFLLGYMNYFSQGMGQYVNSRNQFYGFYAQDSWHISPRLTLNYGVRYEPFSAWNEINHRIEQFNPAAYAAGRVSNVYVNAPKGLLFVGDQGVPERGVNNSYVQFMPRVGFAYDVFGNGKTSLRGGAGSFYDSRMAGIDSIGAPGVSPWSINVTINNPTSPFSNPYQNITNPFPASLSPSKNTVFPTPVKVYTWDPSGVYHIPVVYNWNLIVEQQINPHTSFRAAYVGSRVNHLQTSLELNPAVYTPGSTLGTDARRLFVPLGNIAEANMGGNESYHSLQMSLQERIGKSVNLTANYTFSKALDNVPYGSYVIGASAGQSYVLPYTMPNYKALDYGPSDFDRGNVFNTSYTIHLPKLTHGPRFVEEVLNDWETSGILTLETGQPLTVRAGTDRSKTGLNQDRAVITPSTAFLASGSCSATSPCVRYLNSAAFSLPAIGSFGNVQKGSLTGPGYSNFDASLARNFPIWESVRLQLRADYFNVLNHTNLNNPSTSVSSSGFGKITGSGDPRIAQMSARINF